MPQKGSRVYNKSGSSATVPNVQHHDPPPPRGCGMHLHCTNSASSLETEAGDPLHESHEERRKTPMPHLRRRCVSVHTNLRACSCGGACSRLCVCGRAGGGGGCQPPVLTWDQVRLFFYIGGGGDFRDPPTEISGKPTDPQLDTHPPTHPPNYHRQNALPQAKCLDQRLWR